MRFSIINHLAMKLLPIVITVGCAVISAGCSGSTGFQGGNIPSDFTGIGNAIAVSPQTIKLDWNVYPGANKYNVYSPDANSAIASPTFNTYLFEPIPLDPNKTYQYSVSAVDPITGLEVGDRTAYTPVQLLPHFNFKQHGHITAASKNSILVTWDDAFPSVNYKVYVAEKAPTGTENYNNFVATSIPAVNGVGSALVTGLGEGHEYCAVVVASYLDSTNDSPNGVLFTTDIGTTLSSDAYMKGVSGTFSDSVIAQSQQCVRTLSDFSVTNLKIYAPKATFSNQPTFYVSVPGDITADNSGNVLTQIYQINQTTGFSTLVGQTIGTGTITPQTSLTTGRYKFFGVATDLSNSVNAQAIVEIVVGPNGSVPASDQNRQWVYVRAFNTNEDPAHPVGYFPEKQQGGLGPQREGSSVAIGDFNCDGTKDLAIGIPNASLMANDNRPAQQGKVIIYYNNANGTPGTTTRVQTITFDVTSFAGEPGRNLRLGTSLYVGNFNGDNQQTNQYGTGLNANFQCDDLAIGSGYGPLFVLYGSRDIDPTHGVYGGLNYINSTSYSRNPSSSCDPSSNVCQPTVYTAVNLATQIGLAMTSGDYNGDGYEDLVATSGTGGGTGSISPHGIWVFRGSEYGLITPSSFTDGFDSIVTTPGPYPSFPFIPVNGGSHAYNATYLPNMQGIAALNPGLGWGAANFGVSAATLKNAYYDSNGGVNGTKKVRDEIAIGNPLSNSVNICIPRSNSISFSPTFTSDSNLGFYWDCKSQGITPPAGAASFGASMATISNALRFRPDQFQEVGCASGNPNCTATSTKMGFPGAIAVGATGNGQVYLYYGVSRPNVELPGATRETIGNHLNTYYTELLKPTGSLEIDNLTPVPTTTGDACALSAGKEVCDIQIINHPTTTAGNFAQVVGAFPGNVVSDTAGAAKDTTLAVAAPFRNFVASGGLTYYNVGSVQTYQQNSSGANNPFVIQASANLSNPCDTDGICRFSNGFSNSLTTSLDYDGPNESNVNFGLGGIVGGPLQASADGSTYNSNSDIAVGAPGYIAQVTISGSPVNVIDNGAAMTYFSHGGTYRTFTVNDSGPAASPWHIASVSFAQEADYKFHQAISVGDLNQDGIGDVAVRFNLGSTNRVRFYYGSTGSVTMNSAPGSYTDFSVPADTTAGKRFVPAGKMGAGQFPFFFVTGQSASYLYPSGIGGLTIGVPTAFGIGAPRKLYAPFVPGGPGYLDFSDSNFYNPETIGNIDSTLGAYTPFAVGDFNGDGFEDFAVGMSLGSTFSVNDNTAGNAITGCNAVGNDGAAHHCGDAIGTGNGRILVFYGGSGQGNGFQTQPDVNGGFPLTASYFTDYSADLGTLGTSNGASTMGTVSGTASYSGDPLSAYNAVGGMGFAGSPCLASTGTGCRIQILHEMNTTTLGSTLTSVPVGNCSINGNQVPVKALVATVTRNTGKSDIYVYKPKCLGTANDLSGLISYYGDKKLDIPGSPPGFASTQTSTTLGLGMTAVTGMMGSTPPAGILGHLVVTDQANERIMILPVHTFNAAAGGTSIEGITHFTGTVAPVNFNAFTANGGRQVDYAASVMVGGATGSTIGFGNGISAAGDLNGDGFSDVVIAMTSMNRVDINTSTVSQGAFLTIFGGINGAQTHTDNTFTSIIAPSRNSTCYVAPSGNGVASICNPNLLYIPTATNSLRNGAYERSFLSPNAYINFGSINEGLGSVILGVPGRDSLDSDPSQRILQGGAFYVHP